MLWLVIRSFNIHEALTLITPENAAYRITDPIKKSIQKKAFTMIMSDSIAAYISNEYPVKQMKVNISMVLVMQTHQSRS